LGTQVLAEEKDHRFPSQIKYIVGNEACERFSYYGMRSILVVFLVHSLHVLDSEAKGIYHLFVSANYFFPLFGGFLADRFVGKYRTIFWLSLIYCMGNATMALFDSTLNGVYSGLFLIALGAGGIKPCVAAFVGDQFTSKNSHLINKVYELFYFSINFGSFFSVLSIPYFYGKYGPSVAFAIPGILMGLATIIFWAGRHCYVHVPPSGKEQSAQFWGVIFHGIYRRVTGTAPREGQSFLDLSREKYGDERVEGAKSVLAVFKVLIAVSAFWALFEQNGSSWVLQAQQMDRHWLGVHWEAAQIAALNPILVMLLIPFFSFVVYPGFQKMGFEVTPLRKMGAGMLTTGFAFLYVGVLQSFLDRGIAVNVGWQFFGWAILTASEIMVSITGLEFAYTQAPKAMKSTVMSLWLLTVTAGNLFTALIEFLNHFHGAGEFYFFANVMFVIAVIFVFMATRYQYRSYLVDVGS